MTHVNQRRQTAQTIAWFWDLYRRGLLNLDPPYQRRSVWNNSYKQFFVETILLQYPAPAIFIYEEMETTGVANYSVVDGKQRLTTVFEFAKDELPLSDKPAIERYAGRYFSQLNEADRLAFWRYQFSVEYLPTTDEGVLTDIFNRINKNVARLTRQELRHARFSGEFATMSEDLQEFLLSVMPPGFPRIAESSRRQMKDVELLAQLLLLIENGPQSFSQDDLDTAYSDRDEEWSARVEVESRFREVITYLSKMAVLTESRRARNQADFYSIFGAVLKHLEEGTLPHPEVAAMKLDAFLDLVEDEERRSGTEDAQRYYEAARSASNDLAQRVTRISILHSVLSSS
jgi:hypothetical protein